jgi:hypothetical protein
MPGLIDRLARLMKFPRPFAVALFLLFGNNERRAMGSMSLVGRSGGKTQTGSNKLRKSSNETARDTYCCDFNWRKHLFGRLHYDKRGSAYY